MKPWYEKHRPSSLNQYVWASKELKDQLEFWIQNPDKLPHLILYGPSGTGKTTLARILAKELNLDTSDVLFLNASVHSGADTVRGQVMEFCSSGGWSGLKLIILDEAERLTRDAQEMLRGIIDQYSGAIRFIFTCNELRRLILPLQGRCQAIEIDQLDRDEFLLRLLEICDRETVQVDLERDSDILVLDRIVTKTYPNLRQAINQLQVCTSSGRLVDSNQSQSSPWKDTIEKAVFGKLDLNGFRGTIEELSDEQIEDVYRFLYENSDRFGKHESTAISTIAEYLYRHPSMAFKSINLCAALIELKKLDRST